MATRRFDIVNPDFPAAGPQQIPRPRGWKPGVPRRWTRPTSVLVEATIGRLAPVDDDPPLGDMRGSAVLVLVSLADDRPYVLLTRRSQAMNNHSGEVSFAGGRIDPGETATEAALREANEEVGLDPGLVTVNGELSHYSTWVSRSHIVPVVASTHHRIELSARTIEVDRVLWVPLDEFTRRGVYHGERWRFDGPVIEGDAHRVDGDFDVHFFELFEPYHETVWGATARMLVDLLDRISDVD